MKEYSKIFLSFMPNYFRPILYGMKKYEYRKRFKNEPTKAFLYLSSPVQEVVGVLELEKPLLNADVINLLDKESLAFERISKCIKNNEKYSIPIKSLQLYKKPISLKELKQISSNFFVPHAYLNIENYPVILDFLENQEMYEKEFVHNHEELYLKNLGMTCKEMERTKEFQLLDEKYTKDNKYNIVKAKYLTRKEK